MSKISSLRSQALGRSQAYGYSEAVEIPPEERGEFPDLSAYPPLDAIAPQQIGVFERYLNSRRDRWSEQTYRLFGLDPAEPPPDHDGTMRLIFAEDLDAIGVAIKRSLEGTITSTSHRYWRGRELRHAETRHEPIYEEGVVVGYRGTILDVTERVRARSRRAAEDTFMRTLFETIDAAVVAVDAVGIVTHWNGAAERIYGWSRADALGRSMRDLELETDPKQAREALAVVAETGGWEGIRDIRHRDGTIVPVHVHVSRITGTDGEAMGMVGVGLDLRDKISARIEVAKTRDHLRAVTDSMVEGLLTLDTDGRVTTVNAAAEKMLGWPEHALLGESMHAMVHYRHRDGSPFPVNECPILNVRRTGEPARVDDDMFICQDETELDVSYTAAPLQVEGETSGVIVVFQDMSDRRAAERRSQARLERISWVGRIKDALETDRIVSYAQPIVDLDSGATVMHELLVRMIDDKGEVISPGSFLPAAEEHGLIVDVDRRMVDHAVRLAEAGHALTVNLSGATVATPMMADLLGSKIAASRFEHSLLTIEVTETSLIENEQAAERFLTSMSELGCLFALDDFGTGYGGFSYLKRMSVDFLKIDMEFVRDLKENEASKRVVAAVVELARGFGQKTIAEGVEDKETMELLKSLGVDFGQGYLFDKPKPTTEILVDSGG